MIDYTYSNFIANAEFYGPTGHGLVITITNKNAETFNIQGGLYANIYGDVWKVIIIFINYDYLF